MNLIEDIVSYGHGHLSADYLCIHETANPGATAKNHRDLWSSGYLFAVHYVCDWTGDVYHCVPNDCMCYQVGYGNSRVIGLEICHATSESGFQACWDTAAEWAAYMLDRLGWGIDRLISHDDARRWWGGTDHTDPIGYFAEHGRTWDEFIGAVQAKMDEEGFEVISDDDIRRIAEASANYIWGFERGSMSAIDRLVSMPEDAARATLGYTNAGMNGADDVYQLLTDIRKLGGWDYVNKALEDADVYQILRDIRDALISKKA